MEISKILKAYGIHVEHLEREKVEIQAESVEEIALFAGENLFLKEKKPILVDDTGLYIEALNGFPGPYAEYFLKTVGLDGLLELLKNSENRKACFKTAICFCYYDIKKIFVGELCGEIGMEKKGYFGFGYDPVFVPNGYSKTLAEMSIEEKNKISHRGIAARKFAEWFTTETLPF
ncbi:RdgB/HAM1 family non-canonical purine NTP pyrophosphatase [Fervidicoccus fontis]|uniref:Nucleoside-triphosphatase n=3 Tax=Fervidicoccaceae TaxID=685949 RepID=I0A2W2_FERFK|nr:nucleoside-triphosphatase [Fervidicoccus fontis Kam940]MBE9390695.1 RdgB/HAM1 family non-canonical purine NTP pyrophosphatase [Fervidicoccus fontis]PMB76432.1 MAG: non-canonical purine NTP pyrophosphatase, RdgB/HAM1 family [Fervidicoccus fontis]HEW63829.1 RdgB/HAM1 family non-canonical purine NTP pyrophosphatase [Fervidicoccus fontis]